MLYKFGCKRLIGHGSAQRRKLLKTIKTDAQLRFFVLHAAISASRVNRPRGYHFQLCYPWSVLAISIREPTPAFSVVGTVRI